MIRRRKDIAWEKRVSSRDMAMVMSRVNPRGWYPMDTFERLGNAILAELADGNVMLARMWGTISAEAQRELHPDLVAADDPMESLMRFRVLRRTFFDFEALEIDTLIPNLARIAVHYRMGAKAEKAAAYQTMGFFERVLELSGAKQVTTSFVERGWEPNSLRTLLLFEWQEPGDPY